MSKRVLGKFMQKKNLSKTRSRKPNKGKVPSLPDYSTYGKNPGMTKKPDLDSPFIQPKKKNKWGTNRSTQFVSGEGLPEEYGGAGEKQVPKTVEPEDWYFRDSDVVKEELKLEPSEYFKEEAEIGDDIIGKEL